MSLVSGSRIGVYEIVGPLGAGGMGEVYRARDIKLGRDVAIKALRDGVGADPDRAARFEREAHLLASLNHPNIATIHGLVEAAPSTGSGQAASFIVMELVDGESLAKRLESGPIAVNDTLAIARQIADALSAAHLKGIVHRDLKPANVMLTPDGRVKVLDFGLAAQTGTPAASSTTMTSPATQLGVILGTAAYMAPEQAKGRPVDKRADVWAFGGVLYEMLTGTRPFPGDDITEIVAAIMRDEPDWTRLPGGVAPTVQQFLRRCFEKNPGDRLQDLGDMRLALDGAFDVASAPAVRRSGVPLSRAVLIALALAAVAGAAVWFGKPAPANPAGAVRRFSVALSPPIYIANVNRDVAISPDGMTIAYIAITPPGRSLFVRRLDSANTTLLRRVDRGFEPFVSADGKWVAYNDESDYTLRKISTAGGPPVSIARVGREMRGATWSGDDTIVYATNEGLWRVPAAGGTPALIAKPDPARGEQLFAWPELLPGGNVVFTIRAGGGSVRTANPLADDAIAAIPLGGGTPKVLVGAATNPRWSSTGHLLYVSEGAVRAVPFDPDALEIRGEAVAVVDGVRPKGSGGANVAIAGDGTLVYIESDFGAARYRIAWIERGGLHMPIPAPPRGYTFARLSPDGGRIVLDIRDERSDIWIWDLMRQTLTKLTDEAAVDAFPAWTPDGRTVVFASERAGPRNLFAQASDGSGAARRLFDERTSDNPTSITPDGKSVIFRREGSFRTTGQDIMIGPIAGGTPAALLATNANESNGEISPDGKWLAYESNESGDVEVYVRPFPDVQAARYQVSAGGGRQPAWRADGRVLFYVTRESKLAGVDIMEGPGFKASAPIVVITTPIFAALAPRSYDVTPDGKRFLVIEEPTGSDAPSLAVVLNFGAELKRLTRR